MASKHATERLTKAAALEAAGSGVRVNAIAPGPIQTGLLDRFADTPERRKALAARISMKRVGLPDAIAEVIVFVSSAKAGFINGQISR